MGRDAAGGQERPEPPGGRELGRAGVLGGAVPQDPVLERQQQPGRPVVVERDGPGHELRDGRVDQPGALPPVERPPPARGGSRPGPGPGEGRPHGLRPGRADRGQPGQDLLAAAARRQARDGRRDRDRPGPTPDRVAPGTAAALPGAEVGPPATRRDAERLLDPHAPALEGLPQALGERPQPLRHRRAVLPARPPHGRILAEVEEHLDRPLLLPLGEPDHEGGRLLRGGRPLGRGLRDVQPDHPALVQAGRLQPDGDDAVVREEAEEVGQRLGHVGRAPHGERTAAGTVAEGKRDVFVAHGPKAVPISRDPRKILRNLWINPACE